MMMMMMMVMSCEGYVPLNKRWCCSVVWSRV